MNKTRLFRNGQRRIPTTVRERRKTFGKCKEKRIVVRPERFRGAIRFFFFLKIYTKRRTSRRLVGLRVSLA